MASKPEHTGMDWGELQTLPVNEKWYSLGLKLGIDSQELNKIEQSERRSNFKCKVKMFKRWLTDPAASRRKLINALYSLKEKTLADELKSWRGIDYRPLSPYSDDGDSQLKMETKQTPKDAKITTYMDHAKRQDLKDKKEVHSSKSSAESDYQSGRHNRRKKRKYRPRKMYRKGREHSPSAVRSVLPDMVKKKHMASMPENSQLQQDPTLSPQDIKNLIMTEKIRISILCIGVAGLPYSGKTTLVKSLLKIDSDIQDFIMKGSVKGLSMYEAVRRTDKVTGQCEWTPAKKEDAIFVSVAYSIIKACMQRHMCTYPRLPNLEGVLKIFDNPHIDAHFSQVLKGVTTTIREHDSTVPLSHAALTFINVMDVGHNKSLYEVLPIFAGGMKSFLLLNILDLKKSFEQLHQQHTLKDVPVYKERQDDQLLSIQSTLAYYMTVVAAAKTYAPSKPDPLALLVGTRADLLSEKNCDSAKRKVLIGVKAQATEYGLADDIYPGFAVVNAKDADEVSEKVTTLLDRLIDGGHRFERDIPLSWMFLRTVLYSTNEMYMPKGKVLEYAKKCGLITETEVEDFLELFKDVGSILYSPSGEHGVLYENVVLDPVTFINGMEELYYVECKEINDENLKSDCEVLAQGFLTHNLAYHLWSGECDFYLRTLEEIRVIAHMPFQYLLPEIKCKFYFMPTLRRVFYAETPSKDCKSLIIRGESFHVGHLTVHRQSEFILYLLHHYKENIVFVRNQEYNVLHFQWCNPEPQADIFIRFIVVYAEINIRPISECQIVNSSLLYSVLKTASIEIFGKSDKDFNLWFICPNSNEKEYPDGLHFIPFHPLAQDKDELYCHLKCRQLIPLTEEQKDWIQSPYRGHHESLPRDCFSVSEADEIAKELSHLTETELYSLGSALGLAPKEVHHQLDTQPSTHDVLVMLLHRFRQSNPVRMQKSMAQALLKCGYYTMAVKIYPSILTGSTPIPHPLTARELAIISDHLPHWQTLAEILSISTNLIRDIEEQYKNKTEQCYQMLMTWEKNYPLQTTGKATAACDFRLESSIPSITRADARTTLIHALKENQEMIHNGQRLALYLETGDWDILIK